MTDAKHTPGPWRVSKVGPTNAGQQAITTDEVGIAWVHPLSDFKRSDGWQHDCPEREANARLIASAPDLLAALERIANTYLPEDYRDGSQERAIGDIARAAIAKAKGGSV